MKDTIQEVIDIARKKRHFYPKNYKDRRKSFYDNDYTFIKNLCTIITLYGHKEIY